MKNIDKNERTNYTVFIELLIVCGYRLWNVQKTDTAFLCINFGYNCSIQRKKKYKMNKTGIKNMIDQIQIQSDNMNIMQSY